MYSDSCDWLVVAGAKAGCQGVGSMDGEGNDGFMIGAIGARLVSSSDEDLFRIKMWDRDPGEAPVKDSQLAEDEDADPVTATGGGSIEAHK